jgi:hypothetical protein
MRNGDWNEIIEKENERRNWEYYINEMARYYSENHFYGIYAYYPKESEEKTQKNIDEFDNIDINSEECDKVIEACQPNILANIYEYIVSCFL